MFAHGRFGSLPDMKGAAVRAIAVAWSAAWRSPTRRRSSVWRSLRCFSNCLPTIARRLLETLTQHAEDADDHNLPLMYWYAAEPLAEADPQRALALGLSCGKTIPLVREFMLRRIGEPRLARVAWQRSSMRSANPPTPIEQLAILEGIRAADSRANGASTPPANWAAVYRTANGVGRYRSPRSRGHRAGRDVRRRGGDGPAAKALHLRPTRTPICGRPRGSRRCSRPRIRSSANAAALARRAGDCATPRSPAWHSTTTRRRRRLVLGAVSEAVARGENGRPWPRSRRAPPTASRC